MGRSRNRSNSRERSRSRSLSSTSSGRAAKDSHWDGEGGYRIHISDLNASVTRKEVEKLFSKFGPINEVWVATNPPCFAFVNFKHRSDAEQAIRELDGKVIAGSRVGMSFARKRNYGGRRPFPSGSRSPYGGGRGGWNDRRGGRGDYGDRGDRGDRGGRRYSPRRDFSRSRSDSRERNNRRGRPRSSSRSRSPAPKREREREQPSRQKHRSEDERSPSPDERKRRSRPSRSASHEPSPRRSDGNQGYRTGVAAND